MSMLSIQVKVEGWRCESGLKLFELSKSGWMMLMMKMMMNGGRVKFSWYYTKDPVIVVRNQMKEPISFVIVIANNHPTYPKGSSPFPSSNVVRQTLTPLLPSRPLPEGHNGGGAIFFFFFWGGRLSLLWQGGEDNRHGGRLALAIPISSRWVMMRRLSPGRYTTHPPAVSRLKELLMSCSILCLLFLFSLLGF